MVRLGQRVQVGAAMRVHDALRPPGGTARVVDRDRVVLGLEPVLGLAFACVCKLTISFSTPLTPESLAEQDCVLIATDHSAYDYDFIVRHAQLVVDTRNATRGVTAGREKVLKA